MRPLTTPETWTTRSWANGRRAVPGLLLSAFVAVSAVLVAPLLAGIVPIPAMVIALVVGIALNPVARKPSFQPGIVFASGFLLARVFGLNQAYGALAGAGTAVCGASATLATSIVLPDYKGKETDVVFVVVAVNALSTLAMVLYPLVCALLGFGPQTTGVMLGATIHDVAQVVGAGYAVSETAGNTAVIVKLFRVFLMLPVVLLIGWLFARRAVARAAKIPIPVFALVFVALCALNSVASAFPATASIFALIKAPLIEASTWGLLIAISALGLGTSLTAIAALGWRHVATVIGTTCVIFFLVTAGLMMLQ
jgi:uncharacterized integral membrane protein (TIGR00698 family)